jgi:hypothetical protein
MTRVYRSSTGDTALAASVAPHTRGKELQWFLVLRSPPLMRPHDNLPTTREKIQDVLDILSSKEVFLDPNTRYTKAEMIEWCASWIAIYDKLPQNTSI